MFTSSTTALVALLPFLAPALASHNIPRGSHGHDVARDNYLRELQELEERQMPITTTRTIMVQETLTQTIWVEPTGQVVFEPGTTITAGGQSTSVAASSAGSVSAEESASASSHVESVSASITATGASTSSGSSAPRPSRASGSGPPRSSPAPTSYTASVTDDAYSSVSASMSDSQSAQSAEATESSTGASAEATSTSSAAQSSITEYGASSSWSTETLWAESSSAIISSVSASASAWASLSSAVSYAPSSTLSSAPSATASSSSGLAPVPERVMCAYYPDWSGWYLPPESVDWSRFDVIDFAFALPTADGGLQFTQDDSSDLLHRLVKTGHAAGKRVKLSIGGWTGSAYFSNICADSSLRATFVANIVRAYAAYNLDGIDIDWEYPGTSGAAGNGVSSSDSANYLLLFQDMRAALPSGALITSATQVWPWAGSNGQPLSDVSAFASVIDWILIMNYDIWGSSSTPGPNAPLSDGCGNSTQPLANAYAAVSSWTTAGMPANKITLGVPAYGYLQSSWATSLRQRRSSFPTPPHKRSNGTHSVDPRAAVTVYNGNGGSSDGQVMFESLVSQGALSSDGQGGFVGSGGFTRHWDSCSSTPWIKSDSTGQIITYDDTESMSLKGQFAAQAGIKGCNIFSIDGDWTGSSWPLTDAVRSGLGL